MQRQHRAENCAPVAADGAVLTGQVCYWFNAQMLPLNLRLPPTSAGLPWQKCVDSVHCRCCSIEMISGAMQGMTIDTSVTDRRAAAGLFEVR